MSDVDALYSFMRKPVNSEMVQYLVEITNSIIKVQPSQSYPSPPTSPQHNYKSLGQPQAQPVSLYEFIRALIKHSNVQTTTLMSTLVLLEKLKDILPSNVYGIETTRHRIFLGCLIITAKTLNDSSPVNKHWAHYTNGLLSIAEVNTIERELLEYFNWNLSIEMEDLIESLMFFLIPIKEKMRQREEEKLMMMNHSIRRSNNFTASTSLSSLLSNRMNNSSSMSSVPSLISSSSSRSTLASIATTSSRSIDKLVYSDDFKPQQLPKKSSLHPLKLRSASDNNKMEPPLPLYQLPEYKQQQQQQKPEQVKKSKFSLLNAGRSLRELNIGI